MHKTYHFYFRYCYSELNLFLGHACRVLFWKYLFEIKCLIIIKNLPFTSVDVRRGTVSIEQINKKTYTERKAHIKGEKYNSEIRWKNKEIDSQ